jgi:hypothetical protein
MQSLYWTKIKCIDILTRLIRLWLISCKELIYYKFQQFFAGNIEQIQFRLALDT